MDIAIETRPMWEIIARAHIESWELDDPQSRANDTTAEPSAVTEQEDRDEEDLEDFGQDLEKETFQEGATA